MALTTVRPEGMGFNTGRRNLIINGAMQIAQRGTSNTTSAVYLIDRFKTDFSGGALTNEQVSLTSSDTPYSYGFRKAQKFSNTTAGSTATTDYRRMTHVVEAQNIASSGWEYTSSSSYITLSFWVKSSVAGTYACNLQSNDGTAQNYSFEYTVAADTWTKVTHTAPGNSGITINNDTGEGLRIYWWPYLGTNNTTSGHTNEAWAAFSSSSQVKDFAQNWASTLNATFFVTGVQLEVGENSSDFEHLSFGEELALCQRYFETIRFIPGTVYAAVSNQFDSGGHVVQAYKVTKRTTPTVSIDDTSWYKYNVYNGSNGAVTISAYAANEDYGGIAYGGLGASSLHWFYGNSGTTTHSADAEL